MVEEWVSLKGLPETFVALENFQNWLIDLMRRPGLHLWTMIGAMLMDYLQEAISIAKFQIICRTQ
jgi:hypothetical protein